MSALVTAIIGALFLIALGSQFYSDAARDPAKKQLARRLMKVAYLPLALGALGVGTYLFLWLNGYIHLSH